MGDADFMNLIIALIALSLLYTPLGYLGLLYLVFYFRDLLRFSHPFTQQGDESWGDVLLYLGLITDGQSGEHRRTHRGRAIAFVVCFLVGVTAAFVFPSLQTLFSVPLALAFLLLGLFQFFCALMMMSLAIVPSLGKPTFWRKHLSRIGSPKNRLSSRVLHLKKLPKKTIDKEATVSQEPTPSTPDTPSSVVEPSSSTVEQPNSVTETPDSAPLTENPPSIIAEPTLGDQ
jgi:uncharacterized membrane protein YvlD (DUF360 family)